MERFAGAAVLLLFAMLLPVSAAGGEFREGENLRHERIYLPASTPERGKLTLVDNTMYLDEEGVAGILIYYDDPRTPREIDYIEFYDLEGELLLIAWVDRYGACRVALDRGLLNASSPSVHGILVIVDVGGFL